MKTIILCLAFGLAIFAVIYVRRRWRGDRPDPEVIGNLFACGVLSALAGFVIAIALSYAVPTKQMEENHRLAVIGFALPKDQIFFQAVSGVLGAPAYRVYIRNDEGSIVCRIVPGSAYIIENPFLYSPAIWRKTWLTKDPSSALFSWAITFNETWDTRHYLLVPAGAFKL